MSIHDYRSNCQCFRCKGVYTVRAKNTAKKSRPKLRIATRAEQNARYIDCGPSAWDDRG